MVSGLIALRAFVDRYQQIAEVRAGHGDFTEFHEFLITPWNTALILADSIGTANLTSIGGPADQKVFDDIIQEIDIPPAQCSSSGTALATSPTATVTSRCLARQPCPGTGSTSMPSTWTLTETC